MRCVAPLRPDHTVSLIHIKFMSEKAGNLSYVAGTGSIIGVFAFNGCHHKGIHIYPHRNVCNWDKESCLVKIVLECLIAPFTTLDFIRVQRAKM